jgi:hypothetical protein
MPIFNISGVPNSKNKVADDLEEVPHTSILFHLSKTHGPSKKR